MGNYFHNRGRDNFHHFDDEEVFICRDIDDRRDDDRRDRGRDDDDRRDRRRDGDRCDRRKDDEDRCDRRRDEDRCDRRKDDEDRCDRRRDEVDDDRRCGREKFSFCATGTGILFGVSIGDRVLIRVKNNNAELSLVFQGMIDHIALFTNGGAGNGLLRIPLKDIVTARVA